MLKEHIHVSIETGSSVNQCCCCVVVVVVNSHILVDVGWSIIKTL
jgi:hypothetical protein